MQMFHLQLRQFPHNHCQFNLSQADISSFAELWLRGEWLTVGERQWSPRQAKLTVIEAPQLEGAQLSMGRGWRHVERTGEDVTQRVLTNAASRARSESGAGKRTLRHEPAAETPGGGDGVRGELDSDPAEVAALLGGGPRAGLLLETWRSAAARFPDRSPSESLAIAERELDSASAKRHR
jgi:hypothetical protein